MLSTSIKSAVAIIGLNAVITVAQDVSSSQYWHERYHGILSMAAYGDYATLCPQQTFTQAALNKAFPDSTEAPWVLLEAWGPTPVYQSEGFIATIPEMDKVVIVFKGMYGWENQMNMTSMPINDVFYLDCPDCQAHSGAVGAYLEAKEATNDWQAVKDAVAVTGHQWSITGHGWGGAQAIVASIDLGWRDLSHWSHSHGAPRVLNPASAALYDKLYEGQAGQRAVANDDSMPNIIPESDDYTHVLQGFHIYGTNTTYGMNYDICTTVDDPNCLGGDVETDHWFYYTQVGSCGAQMTYSNKTEAAAEASLSSAYYLTATVDTETLMTTTTVMSTSTMSPTVASNTSTSVPASTSSSSSVAGVAAADAAKASSSPFTGSAGRGSVASIAGVALAVLGAAAAAL